MTSGELKDIGKLARELDKELTSREFWSRSLVQALAELDEWKKKTQQILDRFDANSPTAVKWLGVCTAKVSTLEKEISDMQNWLERRDVKIARLQRDLAERARNMKVDLI